jgi:excisionase family DNA binding protein
MSAKIEHLLPLSDESKGNDCSRTWPDELKKILGALIDLSVRVVAANGKRFILNEILTAEELAARLKVPLSTIEELARRGKLPGAFRVGKHWRFDLDLLRTALPIGDSGSLD